MRALAPACLLVAVMASPGLAQEQVFRSSVESVRLDVAVTRSQRPVVGLTAADFEVWDNGVRQSARLIDTGEWPIDAVLAVDASASVAGEPLQWLQEAAKSFLQQLKTQDGVALLSFSQAVQLRCPLTEDHGKVTAALEQLTPSGGTALYDAIFAATDVATTHAATNSRRPFVLALSDGADTFSWLGRDDLRALLRKSEVVVYAVTSRTPMLQAGKGWESRMYLEAPRPPQLTESEEALQALVKETGGELLVAGWDRSLGKALAAAVQRFRSRYVLAYAPTSMSPGWHEVVVKAKGGGVVSVRSGYER